MTICITTLMEDSLSEHESLVCEHGLSFHIQTPQSRFLFDCGASDRLLRNADKLNIDLSRLDFVVCSHSHYDHAGGLRALAEKSDFRRFITGDGFFAPKYGLSGVRHTYLGVDFDPSFLEGRGIAHEVCGDLLRLDDFCWLVGNFERTAPDETIPGKFVLREGDAFVPDRFAEEICLAIRFRDGVAVLLGCSHPGVLNILNTVRARLGLPIRGVWGGTHLLHAAPERVAATVTAMKALGVRYFGLSHCSGENMLACVERDPDADGCRLRAGDGLFL